MTTKTTDQQARQEAAQPRKLRGTATIWADDRWEFTPQGEGEPRQVGVKCARQSRLFQTTGKRQPRTVVHLSVPSDSVDVEAELRHDFNQLTRGMAAKPPAARERGRSLYRGGDGLEVYWRKDTGRMAVRFELDNLPQSANQRKLLSIFQKLTTCLATNETFLAQQRPSAPSASGR